MKTDENGVELWDHNYGWWYDEQCTSVHQTSDGGYTLTGSTQYMGAGSFDFYLVKTDADGNELWGIPYDGGGYEGCSSSQQTADGGYILAGFTTSFGGWEDFWLVKTGADGELLWSRTFGGSYDEQCSSVQQTADGGYILAGYTLSFGAGGSDFWIVKTDANGNCLWSRTFGGSLLDRCYSIQQTLEGGYILGGCTRSFGAGYYDMWLVKIGPEYPNAGYVTLISPGPPDWGHRLHHVSGALSRLVFTNFCSGTMGSVSGAAATAGWVAVNYADSIVFTSDTWLASSSIDTFWLSHPTCSDFVTWQAGDSSGTIEGPLPVELTTFEAIAGDGQVTLRWRTESELDNDHFVLYKCKADEEDFRILAQIPGHGTTAEPHDYAYVDHWVQNGIAYDYRISDVDIAGRETVHEQIVSATPSAAAIPTDFALHAPYPNPFNPSTTIRYDVKETGLLSLKIFDLLGREVATLVHYIVPAGTYSIDWNADDLPSGLYLCRMEAAGFQETRKMVLLK